MSTPPSPCWDIGCLELAQVLLMLSQLLWVLLTCVLLPVVSRQHCFLVALHCLWLLESSHPFFPNEHWEEGLWCDVLFMLRILQSPILCNLTNPWSLLIASTAERSIFWCVLRDAIIYGYNNTSLGIGLILCLFSRKIVASLLGSMTCLASGSWTQ